MSEKQPGGIPGVRAGDEGPPPYVSVYWARGQAEAVEKVLAAAAEGKAASNLQQRALVTLRKAIARRRGS